MFTSTSMHSSRDVTELFSQILWETGCGKDYPEVRGQSIPPVTWKRLLIA